MIKKDFGRVLRRMQGLRLVRLAHAYGSVSVDDGWSLSDEDLSLSLIEKKAEPKLFNHFPPERVMRDLRGSGLLDKIEARGYTGLQGHFESESFFESRFRLTGRHPSKPGEDLLLVECRSHQGEVTGTCPWSDTPYRFSVLILDWVSFQDPARHLPTNFTPLPGQQYAGLGIFREALRLTMSYIQEMGLDAAINIPEFFHNAVLYAPAFRFFSAEREGRFQAMRRDLLGAGLPEASRALAEGKVLLVGADASPRPIRWTPAEQVFPLSEPLLRYFSDERYEQAVRDEKNRSKYVIGE